MALIYKVYAIYKIYRERSSSAGRPPARVDILRVDQQILARHVRRRERDLSRSFSMTV